jgi:putative DNA primase/helicase
MYNKLLSINGDFPKKFFGNEDIIKMIVGGDTIDAQEKYKPQIEFTPTCRFIFAMNSLPKTDDKSFGFYRRVIIVPFTRVFREEEQDRSLVEKLLCELPGIFIWAVDGLKRLRINRKFTESQKSNELLENYKSEQNSVSMFVEEMCVHDCNAKVKASDLWKRYEEFCAETDIEPLVRREFAKQLKYNYDFFVKTHRWLGEAPQRTYFGIGLKINLNADEENTLQITGE